MALTFKFTEIPPFARREEDALLFNQDGSLEYYIPEDYFGSGKSTSATVEGAYVRLMGSFNYRVIAANGSPGKLRAFNFPTIFLCRPGKIEKRKDVQLDTIPYNELYQYPFECMALNSGTYKIHAQAMGLLYSKICRDPEDISTPFRLSKTANSKMTGYTSISIKEASKYISPFVSLTSENLDEAIMSAVLLSDEEKSGKRTHKESPLERVITM